MNKTLLALAVCLFFSSPSRAAKKTLSHIDCKAWLSYESDSSHNAPAGPIRELTALKAKDEKKTYLTGMLNMVEYLNGTLEEQYRISFPFEIDDYYDEVGYLCAVLDNRHLRVMDIFVLANADLKTKKK